MLWICFSNLKPVTWWIILMKHKNMYYIFYFFLTLWCLKWLRFFSGKSRNRLRTSAPEAGISGREKYLHPTVLCGMLLLMHAWDNCFWHKSPHLFLMINIIVADDLVKQEPRESAATVGIKQAPNVKGKNDSNITQYCTKYGLGRSNLLLCVKFGVLVSFI